MQDKPVIQWLKKFSFKGRSRRFIFLTAFLATVVVGIVILGALVLVVSSSPQTGAQGADWLRNIIGTKAVADLEAVVFTVQDKFHQLVFRVEQTTPSAPWQVAITSQNPASLTSSSIQNPTATSPASNGYPGSNLLPQPGTNPQGSNTITTTISTPPAGPTPTRVPWTPAVVPPLGSIPDEGLWTPYIQDATGTILAYRTFLQPDPDRPYVTVGIVAFNLNKVRLHYALGLVEPVTSVNVERSGQIPEEDRLPGYLLAGFNGGFKTVHGHYGVFYNGSALVAPTKGLGTLAIYKDGSLRIGKWGSDLTFTQDILIYRQNCPLIMHDGKINPQVDNNSVADWGGNLSGSIVTFRSAIGTSQDGSTLYYFAGNSLTMPVLADAMKDAGVYQGMLLDINNYYVHFVKFEVQDGSWIAEPLLPNDMFDNINRYLNGFAHDFFYVTAAKP